MKPCRDFVFNAFIAGVLVVLPLYLAILLLLRAMKSLETFVRPFTRLLPAWFPAEGVISFLLILILCFLVGAALQTTLGKAAGTKIENSVFQKLPGYRLFRSVTRQLVGEGQEGSWKPALAEIEEALVPAFIIEELDDGRFAVFVPSVPTPVTGAIYILTAERVHPLNVPFAQAIKSIARWGAGSKDLVAAMQNNASVPKKPVGPDCQKHS